MDPRSAYVLALVFALSLHSKVINGDSSAIFLDSPTRNFLRHSAPKIPTLSPSEVGAAASVLLGLSPPSTLTEVSSSKLNEVLMPNPFDRPSAVLMLEITGVEGSQHIIESDKSAASSALRVKVVGNEPRMDIHLSEGEVSLFSLNEVAADAECSDKELSDFASWLGGSYVEDASAPLHGELIVPVANGAFLRLHMSKKADREFTTSLIILINNIRRAMEMHAVLANSEHSPAELITGRFDGIKALQDHYGTEGVAGDGLEVFFTSISKIFDTLQSAYQGGIVGVLFHDGSRGSESENMLHVTVTSRSSARALQETEASIDTKIAEVIFVRITLAWTTGIILLLATILGIYYLVSMPITKDTLLYSNVKLD
ncbi:hypothetical protein ACJIZ3_017174 [Penstemon smallii]|uniref:DUF7794 domain-containing protein n=1 Tax=Penstemon smallii TaxID=265156 RepID=A0ABD3SUY2_9LAMI